VNRGVNPLPQAPLPPDELYSGRTNESTPGPNRDSESASLRRLVEVLKRRRRFVAVVVGGLLGLCLLYCLVAPNQYDATAKIALRMQSVSTLTLDSAETIPQASLLSAPLQLETLANVFRSDRLAWRVIKELKLSQQVAFSRNFEKRFPGFNVDAPSPQAQQDLIDRFHQRLQVQSIPRTLLLKIRFRSKDPALATRVVNTLIADFSLQESESRVEATNHASEWLSAQLKDLKARVVSDQQRLALFQKQHGLLSKTEELSNGQQSTTIHNPLLLEIDELERQLVAATSDRILSESNYRAASQGNPEQVLAGNSQLQVASGLSTGMLVQLHAHHSDFEQEQAQLSAEHGPNYPRVAEIKRQLADLDRQIKVEDERLVDRFNGTWKMALDREQLVRRNLDERTQAGMKQNQATTEYELMQMEAHASSELLARVTARLEEGGLTAGIHASSITVMDPALQPVKPVSPDLPLDLGVTLFVSLWLALGGALMLEAFDSPPSTPPTSSTSLNRTHGATLPGAALLFVIGGLALFSAVAQTTYGQAPTPSTSGLPSGVAHPILAPSSSSSSSHSLPNPKDAPAVWDNPFAAPSPLPLNASSGGSGGAPLAAPIGPGDVLDIREFHTPEFHSLVHVSAAGTVTLPMIQEVALLGLDAQGAARAIEKAFIDKGVLLHPQVSVLVISSAGQDVSVLGEVTRPGVYPFTVHHRLLDLISAASGLSSAAGRLVNIFHRNAPQTAHPVSLDPSGSDLKQDHNPELDPGDTVQVSRAGLVYVIGDVVRPGGFPVDPVQGLTVVQALSLAWGPTANAATGKGILIREQKGGRTLTTLNLKRMLHGKEPDLPIHDRDILFVPDSTARGIINRTIETAIQSAIGVSIYSGMVYSQRY